VSKRLRVVLYAVNGTGVGHVSRLLAIAKWMRRLAAHAGPHLEAWFLTSSEADGLVFREGFASFKMPSKTVIGEAGVDRRAYLAVAKQQVWSTLATLRPDLLVVDTFPNGSFGELLPALDLARRTAFVFRPARDVLAARADFQAMLPMYDRIVVPEHADTASVTVPEGAKSRLVFTGPVVGRERAEHPDRAAARRILGVADDALVVYASAGGGGDPTAAAQLSAASRAVHAIESAHLVVGAGPLFRGAPMLGRRTTWLVDRTAADVLAGCDVAISAAGYNSFGELMHAGVPTVFVPQDKPADDQHARATRAEAAGAGVLAASASEEHITAALERLRSPAARRRASTAAAALVPRSHARDAAAELLRLIASEADVDDAEQALDDARVAEAAAAGARVDDAIAIAMALVGKATKRPPLDVAIQLLDVARARGLSVRDTVALAVAAASSEGTGAAKARAARRAVEGFGGPSRS
jgi:predicted glycosyltransferase